MKVIIKDEGDRPTVQLIEGYDQLMTFHPQIFNIVIDDVKIIKHKNKFYVYNKLDADNPIIQEWRNVDNFQYVGGFDSVKKAMGRDIISLTNITFKANEIPTPYKRHFHFVKKYPLF